jgi:hypothetical protein
MPETTRRIILSCAVILFVICVCLSLLLIGWAGTIILN